MDEIEKLTNLHGTIIPYFTVENADELIEFVVSVFDGQLIKENRYDNGSIQHARVRIGNSIIMLNQSTKEYPANVSQMHLYVNDVEGTYNAALQQGASSLMPPNKRPHGDEMAGIKDPCGNVWWIATQES